MINYKSFGDCILRLLSAICQHLKALVSQIRKIAAIVDKFSILESSLFNQILQRIQHDYSVILSMTCLIYNNVNQILPNRLYYNPLKGRSWNAAIYRHIQTVRQL